MFRAFDTQNSNVMPKESLFKIGDARRGQGHRRGPWTDAHNDKLLKEIKGVAKFADELNYLIYFLIMMTNGRWGDWGHYDGRICKLFRRFKYSIFACRSIFH